MKVSALVKLQVWTDGEEKEVNTMKSGEVSHYMIELDQPVEEKSLVAMRIEQKKGILWRIGITRTDLYTL